MLAARGQRDLDGGPEAISDAGELAQVRRQAQRVRLQSALAGLAATGLATALPFLFR